MAHDATSPGEVIYAPSFGEVAMYSPRHVAKVAMWPLVQQLRQGKDWRQSNAPDQIFNYPDHGDVNGMLLQVDLSATCTQVGNEEDGRPIVVRAVAVNIGEVLFGEERAECIELFKGGYKAHREGEEDEAAETDLFVWFGCEEEHIIIEDVVAYGFTESDEDECYVERYQSASFGKNVAKVRDEEAEEGPTVQPITLADLVALQNAFRVLGAAPRLIENLESLKAFPITTN